MLVFLLIGAFAYIISKITKYDTSLDAIDGVIKETHMYSGVDEQTYRTFLALIQIAKEYRGQVKFSQIYLEKALKTLNDIPLYMSPMDADVMNELAGIAYRLGFEFEQVLMKEALNQKIDFTPKYI
jgi:hypothetical protein|tara:strand:+ start:1165 stop:1542 length:378 start_codon:yes stop_codon:yes gene_type:complete